VGLHHVRRPCWPHSSGPESAAAPASPRSPSGWPRR
jgi:hypothetical protein